MTNSAAARARRFLFLLSLSISFGSVWMRGPPLPRSPTAIQPRSLRPRTAVARQLAPTAKVRTTAASSTIAPPHTLSLSLPSPPPPPQLQSPMRVARPSVRPRPSGGRPECLAQPSPVQAAKQTALLLLLSLLSLSFHASLLVLLFSLTLLTLPPSYVVRSRRTATHCSHPLNVRLSSASSSSSSSDRRLSVRPETFSISPLPTDIASQSHADFSLLSSPRALSASSPSSLSPLPPWIADRWSLAWWQLPPHHHRRRRRRRR